MRLLQAFDQPRTVSHELILLDHTGHTTTEWDTTNVDEVRAKFDQIVRESNLVAYAEFPDGDLKVIKEFDETATRIVLSPTLIAG